MKVFYDETGRIRSWASAGDAPTGLQVADIPDGVDPTGMGFLNGELVVLEPEREVLVKEARARRNALLAASDWTQVADAPVDEQAWAVYRKALRDLTEQPGFPNNIAWPERPT